MINNFKRLITGKFGREEDVKNTYYTELLETFDRNPEERSGKPSGIAGNTQGK